MGSLGQLAPPFADRLAKAPVQPPASLASEGGRGAEPTASKPPGTASNWLTVASWNAAEFAGRQDLPSLEVRRATAVVDGPKVWLGLDSCTLMTRAPLSSMRLVGTAVDKGRPKVPLALGWYQVPSRRTRTYGWPGMLSARTVAP